MSESKMLPGEVDSWLSTTLDMVSIGEVERVLLDELLLDVQVRHDAEDARHSKALAALDIEWPPIFVHRQTKRVIDGVHRVHAARRRGDRTIVARFVEGSPADSFVFAVRANVTFGKPLTLVERERAVQRILRSHPLWSDRLIAEACGVSSKTVGAIRRRCSTEEDPQMNTRRIGRDGRARPTNPEASRREAANLLMKRPTASLREVAREVGLSPATVKDVRDRLQRGEFPQAASPADSAARDETAARLHVGADTALNSTAEGRKFSEWFQSRRVNPGEWDAFVPLIPASRVYVVADEARRVATEWTRFADELEVRVRGVRRAR